ncbi:MFS transporter [Caviibacterium pharyngocola]|uniref:MFS transporter n=2 Tax=Caviibacterium pharyngocola TaxID=28159 RepID=A0A2M8RT11_9PAST|nr:MFS transporter [Caviibacterium pharyngocola]
MSSNNKNAWLVVFIASAILLVTSGMRLTVGLFVEPITADTEINIVQISFALAVMQLMWGLSQPIMGGLADKFGALPVLLGGTLLLVLGWLLVPMLISAWGLVLTLGILVAFGTGAGSFSVLMGVTANQISPQQRGTASGIINAGSSFGQFLFAPLVQTLIAVPMIGWNNTFYALAIISLLCLPLSFYLTKGVTAKQTHHNAEGEQKLLQAIKTACKNPSYILIHLAFATCGFHVVFLVTHLPVEVSLAGLQSDVASWSVGLIGLSNVVGSLFVGWCVNRFLCKYILFWMYLSRVILIAIYLFMPQTALTFYIFAIGLGLTWLATVPPTAGAIGKLFGVRYLATLFGFALFSHQIGAFFGAYAGGLAMDYFGNYQYMWYADMLLAFLAAISNLPIKEEKPKIAQ